MEVTVLSKSIVPNVGPDFSDAVHFLKDDIIYRQDDLSRYWYEVVSGTVRTAHLFVDGRRQITGFFCIGDVFGADPDRYRATAEVVSRELWVRRLGWRGDSQDKNAMERALSIAENSIRLLGCRTADARIAAFLLNLRARLGVGDHVDVEMPRSDIADYLGMTISTVSRTFADLARRRLIALIDAHHIHILDLNGLRILGGEIEAHMRNEGKFR